MNTQNFSYNFSLKFDKHWYIEYNASNELPLLRLRVTIKHVLDHQKFWIQDRGGYHHYFCMLEWLKENHQEFLI